MVQKKKTTKKVKGRSNAFFACPLCGLKYENKSIAQQCAAWCKKHRSCNLTLMGMARR